MAKKVKERYQRKRKFCGISNINDVRQHAIDTLEQLSKQEITIDEAGVVGKLCENIMSTLKIQIDVAKMLGREPNIEFLGDTGKGKVIDIKKSVIKQLENN